MKTTEPPIILEFSYSTPINKLWKAITEVDQMTQWFFDNIPSFQAKVGSKTVFPVHNEGRIFTHLWEITEVIPHQKIVYSWKYEEYSGDSFVIFELSETDSGSKIKLTLEVLEDFPDDIPEFKRESGIGGWNYFLGDSLMKYLGE